MRLLRGSKEDIGGSSSFLGEVGAPAERYETDFCDCSTGSWETVAICEPMSSPEAELPTTTTFWRVIVSVVSLFSDHVRMRMANIIYLSRIVFGTPIIY